MNACALRTMRPQVPPNGLRLYSHESLAEAEPAPHMSISVLLLSLVGVAKIAAVRTNTYRLYGNKASFVYSLMHAAESRTYEL